MIHITDEAEMLYHDARELASEWHGGQASDLYAFASSGTLDLSGCIWEAEHANADELVSVLEMLASQELKLTIHRTSFEGISEDGEMIDAHTDTEVSTLNICETAREIEGEGLGGAYGYSSCPTVFTDRGWYTRPDGAEEMHGGDLYRVPAFESRTAHIEGPEWARRLVHTMVCPPRTVAEVCAARPFYI